MTRGRISRRHVELATEHAVRQHVTVAHGPEAYAQYFCPALLLQYDHTTCPGCSTKFGKQSNLVAHLKDRELCRGGLEEHMAAVEAVTDHAALGLGGISAELRQNYVWVTGAMRWTGRGYEITSGGPLTWRVADPQGR